MGIPTNRESATAIEAISTSGQYTPAFLILSGLVHLARWYKVKELHDDTAICVSATRYSNDQLSLEWIEHHGAGGPVAFGTSTNTDCSEVRSTNGCT